MANPLWDIGLPQSPHSWSFAQPNTVVRTAMDTGPPKQRKRFTSAPTPITVGFTVKQDILVIFQAFYRDTVQDGSIPFDWVNPITGVAATYRFIGGMPPSIKLRAGGAGDRSIWVISFQMEEIPS